MDLPKTFDEFVDARKQGFIRAKEFKDNGGKLAGCLCSYTPQELLDAAGVATVGLCGTSSETIPDAEKVLPKNLCPLIKSTYGFAYSEKCPYTYFSDIIIGETTCDGKKKMYELLNEIKETYVLHLPQSQERPYAKDIWYEEVKLLKEKLEEKFNCTITEEGLRKAAHVRNELRKAQLDMYHLQKLVPPAMKGTEMMIALQQGTFTFDVYQQIDNIRKRVTEAKKAYEEGKRPVPASAKRILLTGCPTGGVIQKVGSVIENNGGVIVSLDDCSGERTNRLLVDENAPDILRAISDRYLSINCSVMTSNNGRLENTAQMIRDYQVDGVVEIVLQACHTFNVEAFKMGRMAEEMGIPSVKIIKTHIQAPFQFHFHPSSVSVKTDALFSFVTIEYVQGVFFVSILAKQPFPVIYDPVYNISINAAIRVSMILTEGMNLEDVPAVVDRMGAEAETVDRAAEAPEMAVRMVVGQADGDRIHGDQAVVAQADLVQWDLQDHGDHRDFPDTRGPRVRQEPPGRPVPKGRQERQELQDRRGHRVR